MYAPEKSKETRGFFAPLHRSRAAEMTSSELCETLGLFSDDYEYANSHANGSKCYFSEDERLLRIVLDGVNSNIQLGTRFNLRPNVTFDILGNNLTHEFYFAGYDYILSAELPSNGSAYAPVPIVTGKNPS